LGRLVAVAATECAFDEDEHVFEALRSGASEPHY
jgi:hypothetical protein